MEKEQGLKLCHLLMNKKSFTSFCFIDADGKVLKSYSTYPKQNTVSWLKNNHNVDFEEWKLRMKIGRREVELVGDDGYGVIMRYNYHDEKDKTVYIGFSEFVDHPNMFCDIFSEKIHQKMLSKIKRVLF